VIEQQSTYRSIFKATSLFGGVQVINIIITIIRGKAVAVLLGTSGMGLNALFLSTLNIIRASTNFGLPQSAVKYIAEANGTGNETQVSRIVSIFQRWIWLTAILGTTVTLLLSHWISKWTFGNEEYTFSFMFLSITFIFTALSGGMHIILTGLRKLKLLAMANILGSAAGLLVSLPFFYFYGEDGIVPAIIANWFIIFLISSYLRKKVTIKHTNVSWNETWNGGLEMSKLGITMSSKLVLISLSSYILNIYIIKAGSLNDLGLYNAGNTIILGYVGMIFTAMATDYFPRLSEVINLDLKKWQLLVNQQAELVLLILGPILLGILITAPYLIMILLTAEFLEALDFIQIAVPSILLKGVSWCLDYIYLAKDAKKYFFISQFIGHSIILSAQIGGYYFYGFAGLGIALTGSYALIVIGNYLFVRLIYKFTFNINVILIFLILFASCLIGMLLSVSLDFKTNIFYTSILFIGITIYCVYLLDKRIGIIKYFKNLRKKA